jgi:type IV secretory pathway TrbL component
VWQGLISITQQSGGLGLAALLIMVVFVVMSVILLVYYVGRLVTLYLGAVLAPLVLLLWLLPSFKDFAANAAKTYLTTIFVLFVHVIILELAASIFATLITNGPQKTPDPIMALIVGLSTLVALLKTQGVMTQLAYASIGPKAVRRLSTQFVNGLSHVSSTNSASGQTF